MTQFNFFGALLVEWIDPGRAVALGEREGWHPTGKRRVTFQIVRAMIIWVSLQNQNTETFMLIYKPVNSISQPPRV